MSSVRVTPDVVHAAQAGDAAALDTIVERTYSYVKGCMVRLASEYGYAEEATQEAYIVMLDLLATYEDRGIIEQWLCGIARYRLLHIERRERLRAHAALHVDMPATDRPDRIALERLSIAHIRRLLTTLSPGQRMALELRIVAGYDTEATAACLGKSRQAIKHAVHHGTKRLRERFVSKSAYYRYRDGGL